MIQVQQENDRLEEKSRDEEMVRRKLHNTILELKGNIRVFCRVRPSDNASTSCVSMPSRENIDISTTSSDVTGTVRTLNRSSMMTRLRRQRQHHSRSIKCLDQVLRRPQCSKRYHSSVRVHWTVITCVYLHMDRLVQVRHSPWRDPLDVANLALIQRIEA